MKYYTQVSTCWQAKNAAQAAAQGYAITLDAALMDDSYLDEFVEQIRSRVATINKQFPRCGDLDFQFQKHNDLRMRGKSIYVDGPNDTRVFTLVFHEVRQELPGIPGKAYYEMMEFGSHLTGLVFEMVDARYNKFIAECPEIICFGSYLTGLTEDVTRQMYDDYVRSSKNNQANSNQDGGQG